MYGKSGDHDVERSVASSVSNNNMGSNSGEKVAISNDNMGHDSEHAQGSSAEVLALTDLDPALAQKMHLVNNVSCPHGGQVDCLGSAANQTLP